jgi:hypothetical protein
MANMGERRTRPGLLSWFGVLALLGCQSMLPATPRELVESEAGVRAESLRGSVQAIVDAHFNLGRQGAVQTRAEELGLGRLTRKERIDWFSLQRNVIVEIPGESERLVYVVAHYDKTDLNPLKFVSLMLNGALDEPVGLTFLGQGAIDNATGVAVTLELAATLRASQPQFTYRFLLTGSEESGLRGARAHVARLTAAEKDRIELAINLDTVGIDSSENCVTRGISSSEHLELALSSATDVGVALRAVPLPESAATDYAPFQATSFWRDFGRSLLFNLPGALLPQRSYFTSTSSAPVLNFSACEIIGLSDYLAGTILLPVGRLHGPRDTAKRVHIQRLYDQYAIVLRILQRLEADAKP